MYNLLDAAKLGFVVINISFNWKWYTICIKFVLKTKIKISSIGN